MRLSALAMGLILLGASAPAQESKKPEGKMPDKIEVATLGGDCFWCVQAVFEDVKGVISAESGYMGGKTENPSYQDVCTGKTGHAEVCQIKFDPSVRRFKDVL